MPLRAGSSVPYLGFRILREALLVSGRGIVPESKVLWVGLEGGCRGVGTLLVV